MANISAAGVIVKLWDTNFTYMSGNKMKQPFTVGHLLIAKRRPV